MIPRKITELHVRDLRARVRQLAEIIDDIDERSKEPWFRQVLLHGDTAPTEIGPSFGVGWSRDGKHLTIDSEEITRHQAMKLATGAFWMVFEGERDAGDPSDPETFERALAEFTKLVRARCCQR